MNSALRKLWDKLQIQNGVEALAAALFSLLISAGILWLFMDGLYAKTPVYEELVAGGTIWDGYNKQADMTMFYLLYLLIPIFFCLFLYIKHSIKTLQKADMKIQVKQETRSHAEKRKQICNAVVAILFGIESIRAVEAAALAMFPARQEQLGLLGVVAVIGWLLCVCIILLWLKKQKRDASNVIERILMVSQILLPVQFLGYYKFYYQFESEEGLIPLFYSGKWKWACIGLFLGFFLWMLLCMRRKKSGIYLPSLMMVTIGHSLKGPEGIMSVDFFHNGEMAFPMQQLVSYGKVPYFDLDPIHGMCDYFFSLLNYVFFDGSYMAQNAAIFVAGICMAMLLAAVMGICMKNRYMTLLLIYLFMPFLVQNAGVRYVLFFASFIILFSEKVRKDSFRFLWWWVLLCIIAIFWNVSIGSSMAVAFLPEVLYRIVKDILPRLRQFKTWEKTDKKRFLIFYGLLFVIGVCYIPWFLQILRFLSENAGTTLYVNGTAVFGDEFQPVHTFALLLPYLAILIYALCGYKKGKSAFVTMFTCLLIISNYACVRYDAGVRLTVLAVFFMLLFAVEFYAEKGLSKSIRGSMLVLFGILSVWLVQNDLPKLGMYTTVTEIPGAKEITIMGEEIEDPVVYVSGDSVGMPALGTGFIQGNTLNSLKNVQAVLEAENANDSYLDLTNKISHYVIFNKESVLPFTSAYNISNEKMQQKAIELVEENRPHLILISPLITFDLAPISIRSMAFYEKLMEMGYEPYVYGDVVYLLDGESVLEGAVGGNAGKRSLGLICHKEHLGMLPYIWGKTWEQKMESVSYVGLYSDAKVEWAENEKGGRYVIKAAEGAFEGDRISYVAITAAENSQSHEAFSFRFQSDVDGLEYTFRVDTGKTEEDSTTYLIPVGSSPFWQYSDVEEIIIDGNISDIQRVAFY